MSSITTKPEKKGGVKKSVVDHSYTDYSQVDIKELIPNFKGVKKGQFPAKLHRILSKPEYANIVTWKSHGRAWAVVDKKLFTSIVLPKYFDHNNFDSFNRSVNGWGFKRLVGEGPDQNAYYHELFLFGRPELTRAMTRLVNPGKRLPNKNEEPDLYEMSRKHPLSVFPSAVESRPAVSEEAHMMGCEPTPSATLVPSQAGWAPSGPPNAMGYPQPPPMPQSQPPPNMQPASRSQPHQAAQGYNVPMPYGYAPYQAPPGHYYQPNNPYHPHSWMMTGNSPHGMHPQHPMVYYPPPTASQKRQALKKRLPVLHSNARAHAEGKGGEGRPTQTVVTSDQGKTLNEVLDRSLNGLVEEIDQSAELLLRDDMSLDESLSDLFRLSSRRSSIHEAYEALEQDVRVEEGGSGYQQQLQHTHMSIDSICHALQPIPVGGKSEWSSSMNTNQRGGYPPSGRMG